MTFDTSEMNDTFSFWANLATPISKQKNLWHWSFQKYRWSSNPAIWLDESDYTLVNNLEFYVILWKNYTFHFVL